MKYSIALQNCQSIEKVVKLINDGGTSEYEANELVAQYAFNAALDNVETNDSAFRDEVEAQVYMLSEAGAKFDYEEVFELFNQLIKGEQ